MTAAERESERNGVENGDRQKVTRTATNDPLSNGRQKKSRNFNMTHSTLEHRHSRDKSKQECTALGKRVVPRLRELAPSGQRESGGGIHAT